jgi:hypothetical protein
MVRLSRTSYARRMLRQISGTCFAVLTVSLPVHAEPPPSPRAHPPLVMNGDKIREAKRTILAAQGDRLRQLRQFADAAKAYAESLELGDDPIVGGRLGVLLTRYGNPALAADYLMDAIERGTAASPTERLEFLRAYDQARALVCRVVIDVSEAHAQIFLDGELKQADGITGFTMFIAPGDHELRARLNGFDDAWVSFEAKKGGDARISLVLQSRFPILPAVPKPESTPSDDPKLTQPPLLPSSNIVGDPNYSPKEDPFYVSPEVKKARDLEQAKPSRGSIYAGPVVVFGVASWMPAVGAAIGGAWRPNQYFSLGLEGRAAWLTVGVAGKPISAMTGGGTAFACGHVKWFFGCALGHFGAIRIAPQAGTFIPIPLTFARLGGGARVGAQVRLSRSFNLAGTIDALVLNSGIRVGLEGTILAEQPPLMIGSAIAAEWGF